MTIPFLDLFRKLTGRSNAVKTEAPTPAPAQTRAVRPKKSETERLSKTVMPNATRSLSGPDPFRSAAATAAAPRSSLPLELGARGIELDLDVVLDLGRHEDRRERHRD